MRPWVRGQMWLLPPSLDEMIPPNHVVRFIAGFVEQLAVGELGLSLETAERGGLQYDPRLLLAAWIYGFMMRIRSSRRLEVAATEQLPLMWLLGGQHPDHTTLARFLATNREVMRRLFKRTVHTAVEVGLVGFAFQAVDGTRVSAVSRDKMLDREALLALDKRADEAIAKLEHSVAAEEENIPAGPEAQVMPEALKNPEELKERIRVALAKVDERQENRKSHKKGAVDSKTGQPRGPQVHLTDPEAVLMKGRHGIVAGYNGQAAVDDKARVIVAADVIAQATDNEAMVPMLEQVRENTGRLAEVTAWDAGYHSAGNLAAVADAPTDVYVGDPNLKRRSSKPDKQAFHKDSFTYDPASDTYRCPMGNILTLEYVAGGQAAAAHGERVYRCHACQSCPQRDQCTKDRDGRRIRVRPEDDLLRAHRNKMRTSEAKDKMKQRSATVEPVFGIMRDHMALTRFLHRGLAKVRAEWHLLCAAFNLRVIWKVWWCRVQRDLAVAA
jgi:transposase